MSDAELNVRGVYTMLQMQNCSIQKTFHIPLEPVVFNCIASSIAANSFKTQENGVFLDVFGHD